tara:strand:+ start:1473 stop:2936 length:1464 start_codon:yes stop_codon:yes gene_type:complete
MDWLADKWIFLLMFIGYTAILIRHAIEGNKKTKNVTDYFIGGRSLGGITIGLSFFATYSSTNSFIGFSGQAYSYGIGWLLVAPCAVIFSLMAWVIVAPKLRTFTEHLDSVTVPDFIGFRYGSNNARLIAATIVIFSSFLYMTAVFKGAGNLLQSFLDMSYELAIFVVLIIVMLYTTIGGFISVAKTDAVQGIIMCFAAIILFWGASSSSGGVTTMFDLDITKDGANLLSWDTAMPFTVLLGVMMASTMKFMVEPRQLSRFYAINSQKSIRTGRIVSTAAFFVVYTLLVPIGLYAHRIIETPLADSDMVVPTLLSNNAVFNPLLSSFLVLAMVAAAMSSLDSVLLVMASTFHRDIISIKKSERSKELHVRATRMYVIAGAIITALIALRPPGGIVTLTSFSGSLYAACFLPAILLGLHWRRGNSLAVCSSMVAGVFVLLLWPFFPLSDSIHKVFPAMLLSTILYLFFTQTRENTADERINSLFANNSS